jgi:hypothetical protein
MKMIKSQFKEEFISESKVLNIRYYIKKNINRLGYKVEAGIFIINLPRKKG